MENTFADTRGEVGFGDNKTPPLCSLAKGRRMAQGTQLRTRIYSLFVLTLLQLFAVVEQVDDW